MSNYLKYSITALIAIVSVDVASAQNRLESTGNVGISTLNPQYTLDVKGTVGVKGDFSLYGSDNNGESNTPSPHLIFQGTDYAGATMLAAPREQTYGRRGFTISTHSDLSDNRNLIERFRINYLGDVGIGTSSPQYKLDVIGTIRSREIKVDLNGADYVFENDFKLRPLKDVEKFIKINKHLPDVAPAEEMQKNGADLGKLNTLLLQKIEELTLYMIKQEQKVELLERNIKALSKQQTKYPVRLKQH